MAILDFIKKQFIDIIEWTDDSRDTLSFRFPDEDKEIKNGAQLIVRESQIAQFVYLGQFGDTFLPGKHTLTTDNIPVLSTLQGLRDPDHPWRVELAQTVESRRILELDLRKALANEEFELFYQPLVNLKSGKIATCDSRTISCAPFLISRSSSGKR